MLVEPTFDEKGFESQSKNIKLFFSKSIIAAVRVIIPPNVDSMKCPSDDGKN